MRETMRRLAFIAVEKTLRVKGRPIVDFSLHAESAGRPGVARVV
jgi:hypothetical protein